MIIGAGEQARLDCPCGLSHALPLSYGLPSGRSLTFDIAIHEVTALFTTGGGDDRDTIREQAIAVTRRAKARRKALWPLSYRCMVHRAGFEPATSRVIGEVTAIFTTDRDGGGGERAILLPLLRALRASNPLGALRLTEVTDIFTTARPMLSHRPLMGTLGNGRYRLSVTTTQDCPCGQILRRAACKPLPRSHPGACVKGGIRTRFTVEKYPTSSPPASVEPRPSRQTDLRKFYRGAVDAPHVANHSGSLCHRCPAHRLVPSGRPRALGHAPLEREPRDPGLPFRPMPGCSNGPRGGQQKTLRSGRLGRVREKRTVDLAVRQDRSHEPGMRHRLAVGHSTVVQIFRSGASSLGSRFSRTEVFARPREIRLQLADVKRGACEKCK